MMNINLSELRNTVIKRTNLLFLLMLTSITLHKAAEQAKPKVSADLTLHTLQANWNKPARTYKLHTRWWWPGNALTKEDITFQLEQMARQGMGGVEIMTAFQMYEKANAEYLSPEHRELMRYAVVAAQINGPDQLDGNTLTVPSE